MLLISVTPTISIKRKKTTCEQQGCVKGPRAGRKHQRPGVEARLRSKHSFWFLACLLDMSLGVGQVSSCICRASMLFTRRWHSYWVCVGQGRLKAAVNPQAPAPPQRQSPCRKGQRPGKARKTREISATQTDTNSGGKNTMVCGPSRAARNSVFPCIFPSSPRER